MASRSHWNAGSALLSSGHREGFANTCLEPRNRLEGPLDQRDDDDEDEGDQCKGYNLFHCICHFHSGQYMRMPRESIAVRTT